MQQKRDKQKRSIANPEHNNVVIDLNNNEVVNEPEMMDVDTDIGPCDSTSAPIHCPSTSSGVERLTVKMKFPSGKKRMSRSTKKKQREIRHLKTTLGNVRRKNSVLRQRLSRLSKQKLKQGERSSGGIVEPTIEQECSTSHMQQPERRMLTPNSKSKLLLRSSGLSPRQHKGIVKKLQLHEFMVEDMKSV